MKIWHLISNRWNSAISEYAFSAAKATKAMGAEILVTSLVESPIEARFKNAEFELQSIDNFGPGRFARLASIGSKFMPDVIFTYGGPETTAALFLKSKAKLIRFHGYKTEEKGPMSVLSRKLGHLHVDQIIAPSEYVAAGLRDVVSCPVTVVTLGCDEDFFSLRELERNERPELLIFGRLDPVKGHREFLRTFKEILEISVRETHPRPKLRIVGLPANISAKHITEEAKLLGLLPDDIDVFCERISNVSELMSKVSLGVVSSLGSEAICRVAEEFLLCGTPVVSTGAGSLPEVFMKPAFGVCYGFNNDPEAAALIYKTLRQSHLEQMPDRQKRAADARHYFSIARMSESLAALMLPN